ncbi:ubiquinol-cytochrome C chaperone family protein, partial [Staphylococcus aureus]
MVGMLGGRLGAYREALAGGDLGEVLKRNLYRSASPTPAAVAHVEQSLRTLADRLAALPMDALAAGKLP